MITTLIMSTSLVQSSAMNMAEWEKQGHHAPARNESMKQEDDSDDDAPSNEWDRVGNTAREYSEYATQSYGYNDAPTMMNSADTSERLMPFSVYETQHNRESEDDRKMPAEPKHGMYANNDDDRKHTSIVSSPVQRGSAGDSRSHSRAAHGLQPSYEYEDAGPDQMMQPLPLHSTDRCWPLAESPYDEQYGGPVYPPLPPQPSYPPPPRAPEYEAPPMEPQQQYSSDYRASSAVARMHHPSVGLHRQQQQQQQQQHRARTYQPPSRAPDHHPRPRVAAAGGIHRNPSPIYMDPPQQQQQQPPPPPPPPMRMERRTPRLANDQRAPTREELSIANTPRAVQALQTWYVRFNELVEYCNVNGHCNVPQKYEPNPQLGIVSSTRVLRL